MRRAAWRTLPALLALAMAAPGALAAAPSPAELEAADAPAFVRLDGHRLFRVVRFAQEPADARAHAIAGRIARAASDPGFAPESLRVELSDLGTRITANGEPLLVVTPRDAAAVGLALPQYAEYVRLVIGRAIRAYRADREPARLARSAAVALGAAVLAFLLFGLLGWARRRLDPWLERKLRERVHSIRIQTVELLRTDHLWTVARGTVGLVFLAGYLIVVVLFVEFVLGRFPWTRELSDGLLSLLFAPLTTLWSGFLLHLPGLVFIAVLALVVYVLLGFLKLIAEAIDRGAIQFRSFDSDWAWPTHRIVRVVVIALAVVIAFPYIPGSESEAFRGVSLLFGVLLSLGSSSVVSNVIAGYTMIYRRAFHVGDRIRVDDVVGEVTAVRTLVTHLRTVKNEEVVLPNSTILNATVTNYSTLARTKGLILHTTVGIGYEVPWRQVEAMLLLAAGRCTGLLPEPKPFVLQRALGDFAITYELNVYTDAPDRMLASYADLHRHVLDVFNEYGVQIMTPAYEGDPEAPKVVPREQWHAAPAAAEETRTPAGE